MNNFKKMFYVLSWLPVAVVNIALILFGLVAVPIGLAISGGTQANWPRIFWLWGNNEEWVPLWWFDQAEQRGAVVRAFPRFWWLAIRNPVGNVRYLFSDRVPNIDTNWRLPLILPMEAAQLLEHKQRMAYRWAWAGPFAGYRRVWLNNIRVSLDGDYQAKSYSEFWIGWKLGSKVPGLGFTLQLRLRRAIGT